MNDRYRNYQPRRTPRPKKKSPKRFLLFFLLILVVFGGKTAWNKLHTKETQSPTPRASTTPKKKQVKAEAITNTTWNELDQKINAIIAQNPGLDISVAIIDINSNTKASYGVQEAFHGASTTKVLTAVAYLHDVEEGKQTLAENLGGGSAETHVRRMINRSDNNSWAVLNSAVGYSRLDAYARSIGVNSYKYIGNLMTTSDQALLLSKLYKHQLLNEAHTNLLLSFMQNTNNEDMIPQVIPGGTLYHKYGQLDDRLHDAAVLNYKDKPVVLVIYTKGTGDGNLYSARTALIQEIAKTVFVAVYPASN